MICSTWQKKNWNRLEGKSRGTINSESKFKEPKERKHNVKKKTKYLPKFDSLNELVTFFENHGIGEY